MKFTFLGTGTSYGVPVIGCDCAVCTSSDPRNYRRRCSLYLQSGKAGLLIDTPPDLREQILRFGVTQINAVCLTHSHADHVNGFDDLRNFSYKLGMTLPIYASAETIANMRKQFFYVFAAESNYTTIPKVKFFEMEGAFGVGPFQISPFTVMHGACEAQGFRIEAEGKALAYVPDCKVMPEPAWEQLKDLDVMILDASTRDPHPTHLTLSESIEMMKEIGARRSFITHLSHVFDHETTEAVLPESMTVPYDGLEVEL